MKFPKLFKNRYPDSTFEGKDWIRKTDPEDRQAFSRIGMEASGYGVQGGRALVKKKGRQYMSEIGKRGAKKTAELHEFNRMMEDTELRDRHNW